MHRLGNLLLALGGVLLLGPLLMGGAGFSGILLLAGVLIGAGGLGLRRFGADAERRLRTDDRWTPERRAAAVATGPSGGRRGVLRSLARIESRQLLFSPWYQVGIAFSVLSVVLVGFVFANDYQQHWFELAAVLPLTAHPIAGMTVIAAHRGITRARRDGCDELFASCPLPEGDRILGHLATMPVAGAVAIVGAVALFAATARAGIYGDLDARLVGFVALCGVYGAGAVALGVAVGRHLRWLAAAPAALVAIVMVDDKLINIGAPRWSTDRLLATIDADTPNPLLLDLPLTARVAWFAALAVVVAGIALWGRHRAAMPTMAGGALGSVLAASFVIAPMSDPAALAAHVTDPERTEHCTAVRGADIEFCAPAPYAEATEIHAAAIAPTLAALPPGAAEGLRFRQVLLDIPIDELPAELAAELRSIPPDDGVIPFSHSIHAEALSGTRFGLAVAALGLPTIPGADDRPMVLAGRADGVAVLWLATVDATPAERERALSLNPDDYGDEVIDITERGHVWPDPCYDRAAPVVWSPTDVTAALRLGALPRAEVQALLWAQWDDLDSLTTDELLALADLEPVGPAPAIEARPHNCDW